jgi:hypothetical protein
MFKRMVLTVAFIATLVVGSLAMPQSADAWRGWGRPYRSSYYGPRVYYGRPYRTYYNSYYGPRYYGPRYYRPYYTSYYGGYYGYPDYYYYGPRSGVTFSVGF